MQSANESSMSVADASPSGRAAYGINTYSFVQKRRAFDCLVQLADRGYRRFEVMLVPGHFWPSLDGKESRRAIATLVAQRQLEILTLNQPALDINLGSIVPEMRAHSCAMIASAIELAAEWNASGVIINPGKPNPVLPASSTTLIDCFRRSLDILAPLARRYSVHLIVKNHPLSYLYRAEELRSFFDGYGWDGIGLGYDFANGYFGHEDAEAVLKIQDHVRFLYGGDTRLDSFQHAQIGNGDVPFAEISAMLHAADFRRPTILEIVADVADSAIDASVAYLDRIHWPAG